MKLEKLIECLSDKGLLVSCDADLSLDIAFICMDSRSATENSLFFAKGAAFRPEYIAAARARGACAYIAEKKYDDFPDSIVVTDVRAAMAHVSKTFYQSPNERLITVGVTGTKGKSTTVYYLRSIIDAYCEKAGLPSCAVISSIDTYDGRESFESHLSTPEAPDFWRHLYNAAESGIKYAVCEVSSHALKYLRVEGMTFDVGVFLNFGEDHISASEHSSLEDYFASKLKIFDMSRVAVVRGDDEKTPDMLSYIGERRHVIFGRADGADVQITDDRSVENGISFAVRTEDGECAYTLPTTGFFNVDNAAAAIAAARSLGIPGEHIAAGLSCAHAPGRMQLYKSPDGRAVIIVDYAHNKMSFEALYSSVKKDYPGYSVVGVFGCPGAKAQIRRRDLPGVALRYADYVIITEEDSGTEAFSDIARDIEKNLGALSHEIIEDRGEAVKRALDCPVLSPRRVILLTGKGEETRQKRGREYVPTPSDVEYALRAIEGARLPAGGR